jgi:hypothetical protein
VLGLTSGLTDAVFVVLILGDGDPVGLILSTMLPEDSKDEVVAVLGLAWTLGLIKGVSVAAIDPVGSAEGLEAGLGLARELAVAAIDPVGCTDALASTL